MSIHNACFVEEKKKITYTMYMYACLELVSPGDFRY